MANPIEVVSQQRAKTILDLQGRIDQAAFELAQAMEQIEAMSKEIEELKKPKDAPKLEAVKDSA